MEQKSDYIEREVQKIILFLKMLLSKLSVDGIQIEKSVINNLDIEFKEKLSISFSEMLLLEKEQLILKLENIDVLILENLINVLYEIYKKEEVIFNKRKIKNLTLLTINIIEDRSRIFSLERQAIKNYLNNKIIS